MGLKLYPRIIGIINKNRIVASSTYLPYYRSWRDLSLWRALYLGYTAKLNVDAAFCVSRDGLR